jgi:hypothetical protein
LGGGCLLFCTLAFAFSFTLCFLGWLIFVFLQDLQKKEAAVGSIGAQRPCAVVAEAPKAPMVDKEFSRTPDVVVDKEKESTAAPEAGAKDKESVPKPMIEDGKDKAPSPSRVDAEVQFLGVISEA